MSNQNKHQLKLVHSQEVVVVKAKIPVEGRNLPVEVQSKLDRYYVDVEGNLYRKGSNKELIKMKLTPEPRGYLRLKVVDSEGNGYYFRVHRIVLMTFQSFDQNLLVDHIDRNPQNNKLSNLRAVTNSQNQLNSDRSDKAKVKKQLLKEAA